METWIDEKHKLEWQLDSPQESMKWHDAINYAKSLGDGWRLPTVHELVSLIDYGLGDNMTSKHLPFRNIASGYWSSTTHASSTSYAWSVNFYSGYVDSYDKTVSYYVRCVRDIK